MQIEEDKTQVDQPAPIDKPPKPARRKSKGLPPGPGISVPQFIDLMRRLEQQKEALSNEQVRFIQNALHRFGGEEKGVVKTKLSLPKPKKKKGAVSSMLLSTQPAGTGQEFVDRLVNLSDEAEVVKTVQQLSDLDVERIAREQGFRASGPHIAREKLLETIMHLRQIERIAGAGAKAIKEGTDESK